MKPIKLTKDEVLVFADLNEEREIADKVLSNAIRMAMGANHAGMVAIKQAEEKHWAVLFEKHGLDDKQQYTTKLIDGMVHIQLDAEELCDCPACLLKRSLAKQNRVEH